MSLIQEKNSSIKNIYLKSFFNKKYVLSTRNISYSIPYVELVKNKILHIFLIQVNVLVCFKKNFLA